MQGSTALAASIGQRYRLLHHKQPASQGTGSEAILSLSKKSQQHLSICCLLVNSGASVNVPHGGRYDTALEAASYSGSEPIVSFLLEKDAKVNGEPGAPHNPLQAAAFRGHATIAKQLLDKGAEIDGGEGIYGNALQAASFRNHTSVVQLLLNRDPPASIEAKSKDGESALHWAAVFGGSDFNSRATPLYESFASEEMHAFDYSIAEKATYC